MLDDVLTKLIPPYRLTTVSDLLARDGSMTRGHASVSVLKRKGFYAALSLVRCASRRPGLGVPADFASPRLTM
jgi:hypothetical protein